MKSSFFLAATLANGVLSQYGNGTTPTSTIAGFTGTAAAASSAVVTSIGLSVNGKSLTIVSLSLLP